jgi:hypothetical protein
MTTLNLIKQLTRIGDIDIVKHVPAERGYNVGIEFNDGSYLSVPGKTLKVAVKNLANDWRVKVKLKEII